MTVPIITANSQYCVPRGAPRWDRPAGGRVRRGLSAGPLPTPPCVPRLPPLGAQDGCVRFYELGSIRTIPALTLLPARSCDKVEGRR